MYTIYMNTFSIREAFSYGWNMLTKNFWLLVEVFIFVFGLSFLFSTLSQYLTKQGLPWTAALIDIVGTLIQVFFIIGATRIALKLDREEPTSIKELFIFKGNRMGTYLWTTILYMLIVGVGFILVIIPGFVWALKYQFYSWLVIDKNMSAKEALKTSALLTYGNKWKLLLFWIVSMLVYLVGFILLGIGSIPAGAIIFMATVFVYKKLLKKLDQASVETPIGAPQN